MKKSIPIILILLIAIAGLITKYIDTANVTTGHEPRCCIKLVSRDGSKVTYWGLGYKVVRYVGVSPDEPYKSNIGVKMGSWFMNYEKPTNEILDVKSFETGNTFKVYEKKDVDFIVSLLKYSKYINEHCDGIIDYSITCDNDTYDILISCREIKKGNKQATVSDKDMDKLESILLNSDGKRRIYTYKDSLEEISKPCLTLDGASNEFQFAWSLLSSYIAQGTYEIEGNRLVCKTADGKNVYTFEILENGYKFIESESSQIPKYKYSGNSDDSFAPVTDGAIFD